MLSVPTVPTDLAERDARWLHRTGEHRRVRAGDEIIRSGMAPEHVCVVLEGEFVLAPSNALPEQRVGPGTLLCEPTCFPRIAPRRSVRAATDGVLLCIRPSEVDARKCEDPSFGNRFLKLITEFALRHGETGVCSVPAKDHGNGGAPARANRSGRASGKGNGSTPPTAAFEPEVIEKLLRGDF